MTTPDETEPLLPQEIVVVRPEDLPPADEAQDAVEEEDVHRATDTPMFYLAVVGLLTITITTWVIIFTNQPSTLSWFAFHPPLQSLSILLFGIGILQLQPTSLANPALKKRARTWHQIINFGIGLPCIIAGFTFMVYNKASHGAKHFTTWHSVFGLISFSWLILHVIVGGASTWFNGAALGGEDKAKSLWKYHRLSGYLLTFFLLFTVYLAGMFSEWYILFTNYPERFIGYTIAPALVLIGVLTRIRPSKMLF